MSKKRFYSFGGSEDAWLGYWATVIGFIGALYILSIQLKTEDKKNQIQNIDHTFFNLLEMIVNVLEKKEEDLASLYKDLKETKVEKDVELLENNRRVFIEENSERIITVIESVPTKNDYGIELDLVGKFKSNFHSSVYQDYLTQAIFQESNQHPVTLVGLTCGFTQYISSLALNHDHYYKMITEEKGEEIKSMEANLKKDRKEIECDLKKLDQYFKLSDESDTGNRMDKIIVYNSDYIHSIDLKLTNLLINEFKNELPNVELIKYTDDDKKDVIDKVFKQSFSKTGHFFRLFYRIIKYINMNESTIDDKTNDYIGFLRAAIDEKTMALLFYNARYTSAGKKMDEQLRNTRFFGSNEKFHDNNKHDYFTEGTLLWDDDVNKMKLLTNNGK